MIDQNDPRLTAFVLGELSSSEMTEIEQAIQDSPELAAAVEEIRGVVGLLGDAYVSEEKLSLSEEQKVTLTAKPKVVKSDEARRWIAVAIAASLAAIVFGGWVVSKDYFSYGSRRRGVAVRNEMEESNISISEVTNDWDRRVADLSTSDIENLDRQQLRELQRKSAEMLLELSSDGDLSNASGKGQKSNSLKNLRSFQDRLADRSSALEPALIGFEDSSGAIQPFPANLSLMVQNSQEVEPNRYGDIDGDGQMGTGRGVQGMELAQSDSPMRGNSILEDFRGPADRQLSQMQLEGQKGEGIQQQDWLAAAPQSQDGQQQQGGQRQGEQAGNGQQSDLPPVGTQMTGGLGFPGISLRAGKDGRIIGSDATGKLDEGKNLSERELKEAIEAAVKLTKNETTESFEEQNILLDESDSMRLLKLQKQEQELLDEYGVNHSELKETRKALKKFATAQSDYQKERQWELQQRRELSQTSPSASMSQSATKMRLLEAQAASEVLRANVGTGHPDYESAMSQVRPVELELEKSRAGEGIVLPDDADMTADQTRRRFEKVSNSLEQVLSSFKKVDELKKTGSTNDRKKALLPLRRELVRLESTVTFLEQQMGSWNPNYKAVKLQLERLKSNFLKEKELLDAEIAAKPKSWKRVKAIPNTTRLMVGDKEELDLNGMQVNAQVDGFRARVLVDYFFYNDRERQLEGNFKLRLPDDASLYYFAFGESAYEFSPKGKLAAEEFLSDGTQFVSLGAQDVKRARKNQWDNVKEARMVPKEKAAHAFRETVRRRVDPALVEWSGAGVFSAKVFPIAPKKLHRIVVGYDVNLKRSKDGLKFELSLPEQTGECRVEVNVQDIEGVSYSVTPEADPIPTEREGKLQKRFVFDNDENQLSKIELSIGGGNDLLLSSTLNATLPLGGSDDAAPKGSTQLGREPSDTASNGEADGESDEAKIGSGEEIRPPRDRSSQASDRSRPSQREGGSSRFWTMQVTPELPAEDAAANSRAIFMVDTSLSSSPDKFNVWLNMLESTLDNNRDSLKEFDVLFFNVDQHFWKNKYVANTSENVAELKTKLESLALEGATDLYGAVQSVTNAKWTGDEDNRPDLFLLSDGAATWGETDLRLINQLLQKPNLGSLFAYQTGLNGTAISGLRFLAGQSGGAVFSVATEDEIKTASTAHRKRPWQLKSIAAAGASDVLTAGRVQWVYPGQTITVVGRGGVEESIELDFQQGNESKAITLKPTKIESKLASRMYGHVAVGQLESLGSQVFDVSAAYARHFRITGKTCSLLMLESEEDYKRFDIKPQEDLFVVKAKATSALVAETLEKFAEQLIDPKAKLQAWLSRLESMPGMKFEMPTALKLAMDDIKVEAISQPMESSLTTKEGLSASYLKTIAEEELNYERIAAEASRRATSADDAIKVYSSLVERNPGDIVVARDVAFTAMEMDRPAQAFHLLRRVARARPFQGNIYPAIGQCLAQLGKADMAIVYYEIAMNGTFQRQGGEFKQIVAAEYTHLLRRIVSGKLESSVKDFAAARLETLGKHLPFGTADVVVTMMWNQDQTDVDLHVVEPNGEECSYEHTKTRSGGQITTDIRTGFGPEMYFNANAPRGKYQLKAKFFGSGQNRTSTRNKVYMTIIRGFGTQSETMTRRTIQLDKVGGKVPVMDFGIDP